ncbi:MAG: RDD family protein, partial [Verrucomicrobia bacterium]
IIHGDVVSVGGAADVADDATVSGKIQPVDFGSFGLPKLDWLKQWFVQCVLKLRPLAIGPHLGWLWAVAGVYFLLYLLVAVALPKPVAACVDEMTRRPVTTFFTGLLAKLLVPVVIIVLAATGIGLIVVPFIAAAVFFGVLIGKAALFEYLGRSVGRMFGVQSITPPALALAIGIGIVTLLYLVPVLGLVVLAVLSLWGLGLAVTAGLGGMRKESRPPNGTPPVQPLAAAAPVTAAASMGFAADAPQATAAAPGPQPSAIPVAPHPAIAEALAYPRAGFWERMGAGFLDLILAGILCHLAGPFCLLAALAYFAGMWAWKGTTIGGIVLNLKVVRTDGKPISFVVALVRGLAAAFSMMVLFLGFFWIAWDKERQGWHDKIAGTVVIRVPRGMSLVCL